MVYQTEKQNKQNQLLALLDPALLGAARQIYRTYCQAHVKGNKNPIGVAINPQTHRGQVILGTRPILLPREYFVSVTDLKSEIY